MKNAIKILFILLLVNIQILAQNKLFKSLTVQEGLSDEDINCIIQDKKGFLWIGTESGLNRYDGYEFKIFKYNQNDKNSLPNNSIWSLYEDKKGNIWIGTKSG
ncbi:MAG TPA: two-component regulator propeller domain-containing protein, partial [Ignavibacteriaceae bacterium]|nr:two-component regulator propeller domain-containing protein [Ignavibacteriaceae bacterium]